VQLKLLEQTAGTVRDRDRQMAAKLGSQANATLEDLRDLARGIYPPLLADQGLAAAPEARSRKAAVSTEVSADGVRRYPRGDRVDGVLLRPRGVNNVARYAGATSATITLAQGDGHLTFEVHDDGAGFDVGSARRGTGLQGMADRLDAVGGSLTIVSAPRHGSSVGGRVPVA
jgi:signal transduction histidine kinase